MRVTPASAPDSFWPAIEIGCTTRAHNNANVARLMRRARIPIPIGGLLTANAPLRAVGLHFTSIARRMGPSANANSGGANRSASVVGPVLYLRHLENCSIIAGGLAADGLQSPRSSMRPRGDRTPMSLHSSFGFDVSIIVVSFNTRDLLHECLESALAECARLPNGLRAEILVVDNASGDGSAEMVAAEFAAS